MVHAVIWMSAGSAASLLATCLGTGTESRTVHSIKDFLKETKGGKACAFVDEAALAQLASSPPTFPVIAICGDTLQAAVSLLPQYPWLSHVTSAAMLAHPLANEHFRNVMETASSDEKPRLLDWVGGEVAGRRVLLTHASRRAERLERMTDFFDSKGVGARTTQLLRDAAEELLTNAFYDAPVAAGAVKKAISREQDVMLPEDDACDLVYGSRDDMVFVRVKDPFGALTRERLVQVLTRCARTDMQVEVDESMGGAGLGLWRVFAVASFVAVSVVSHRHTEFLVGIAKRAPAGQRPFSFHLFFREGSKKRFWHIFDQDSSSLGVNQSVTILKT